MTDVPSGLLPEGLSIALVVLFSLALGGLAIGDHTGVSRLGALGLLTLALVGVWLLRVTHRRSLEWYDQRRVLDEGPGPL